MNDENTHQAPAGADPQAQQPPAAPIPGLDSLLREARTLDAQPQADQAKQTTALVLSSAAANQRELKKGLKQVRDAVLPLLFLVSERKAAMMAAIWTDQALDQISESGGEVLALHGVSLGGLNAFGPYIGLAMSLGPVAFGTYKVLSSKDPEPAELAGDGQQQ